MNKESTILSRHEMHVRLHIDIKTNKISEQKRHNRECFHMKTQCYHIRKYFIVKLFWLAKIVYLKFAVQYKIYQNYLAKKHFQVEISGRCNNTFTVEENETPALDVIIFTCQNNCVFQ